MVTLTDDENIIVLKMFISAMLYGQLPEYGTETQMKDLYDKLCEPMVEKCIDNINSLENNAADSIVFDSKDDLFSHLENK